MSFEEVPAPAKGGGSDPVTAALVSVICGNSDQAAELLEQALASGLLSPGGLLACVTRLRAEGDQPRASAATRLLLEAYGRAPRSLAAAISLQQLLAAAGSNARQAAEAVADLATLAAAAGGAAAQLDAVATTGGGSAMQRQDAGLRLVLMTLQAAAHDEGASSTDPGGRGNAAVTPVAVAELLLRLCWERPQLHARVAAAVSRNLLPVDWAAAAAWAASQLDALVSAGVSAASVGRRASAGPGAAPPTLPSLEGPALAEALLSRSQSWLAAWLGTVADVAGANHVVDVCRRHLLLLPATATPTAMPAGAPAAVAAAAEVTLPAVDDLLVLAAKCLAAVCIAACPPGAGGGGDGNHDALGAAPQEAAAAGETAVWAMLTAAAEAAVQQQRPQQLARLLACGLAVCELLPRGGGSAVGSSATGSGGGSSSEGFDRLAAALLPHGPGALQTLLLSSDALHAAASACPSRPALQRLDAAVRRHLLQPPAASQEARDIGSQMLQVIASAAASAAATAGGSSGGQQCLQAAAPGATFLRHIGGSSGGRAIDASGAAAAAAQTASASDPKWSTALVECLTEWETQGATALVKLRGIKVHTFRAIKPLLLAPTLNHARAQRLYRYIQALQPCGLVSNTEVMEYEQTHRALGVPVGEGQQLRKSTGGALASNGGSNGGGSDDLAALFGRFAAVAGSPPGVVRAVADILDRAVAAVLAAQASSESRLPAATATTAQLAASGEKAAAATAAAAAATAQRVAELSLQAACAGAAPAAGLTDHASAHHLLLWRLSLLSLALRHPAVRSALLARLEALLCDGDSWRALATNPHLLTSLAGLLVALAAVAAAPLPVSNGSAAAASRPSPAAAAWARWVSATGSAVQLQPCFTWGSECMSGPKYVDSLVRQLPIGSVQGLCYTALFLAALTQQAALSLGRWCNYASPSEALGSSGGAGAPGGGAPTVFDYHSAAAGEGAWHVCHRQLAAHVPSRALLVLRWLRRVLPHYAAGSAAAGSAAAASGGAAAAAAAAAAASGAAAAASAEVDAHQAAGALRVCDAVLQSSLGHSLAAAVAAQQDDASTSAAWRQPQQDDSDGAAAMTQLTAAALAAGLPLPPGMRAAVADMLLGGQC